MKTSEINRILSSDSFKEELKLAIEKGNDTDYVFDGENEQGVEVFYEHIAVDAVIKLLKEKLL